MQMFLKVEEQIMLKERKKRTLLIPWMASPSQRLEG